MSHRAGTFGVLRRFSSVVVRRPAKIVWGNWRYDTRYATIHAYATGVVDLSNCCLTHAGRGAISVDSSPHYALYSALLASSDSERLANARHDYMGYVSKFYQMTTADALMRLEEAERLVGLWRAGVAFTPLVRPARSRMRAVTDGSHRTACLAAAGVKSMRVYIQS